MEKISLKEFIENLDKEEELNEARNFGSMRFSKKLDRLVKRMEKQTSKKDVDYSKQITAAKRLQKEFNSFEEKIEAGKLSRVQTKAKAKKLIAKTKVFVDSTKSSGSSTVKVVGAFTATALIGLLIYFGASGASIPSVAGVDINKLIPNFDFVKDFAGKAITSVGGAADEIGELTKSNWEKFDKAISQGTKKIADMFGKEDGLVDKAVDSLGSLVNKMKGFLGLGREAADGASVTAGAAESGLKMDASRGGGYKTKDGAEMIGDKMKIDALQGKLNRGDGSGRSLKDVAERGIRKKIKRDSLRGNL